MQDEATIFGQIAWYGCIGAFCFLAGVLVSEWASGTIREAIDRRQQRRWNGVDRRATTAGRHPVKHTENWN